MSVTEVHSPSHFIFDECKVSAGSISSSIKRNNIQPMIIISSSSPKRALSSSLPRIGDGTDASCCDDEIICDQQIFIEDLDDVGGSIYDEYTDASSTSGCSVTEAPCTLDRVSPHNAGLEMEMKDVLIDQLTRTIQSSISSIQCLNEKSLAAYYQRSEIEYLTGELQEKESVIHMLSNSLISADLSIRAQQEILATSERANSILRNRIIELEAAAIDVSAIPPNTVSKAMTPVVSSSAAIQLCKQPMKLPSKVQSRANMPNILNLQQERHTPVQSVQNVRSVQIEEPAEGHSASHGSINVRKPSSSGGVGQIRSFVTGYQTQSPELKPLVSPLPSKHLAESWHYDAVNDSSSTNIELCAVVKDPLHPCVNDGISKTPVIPNRMLATQESISVPQCLPRQRGVLNGGTSIVVSRSKPATMQARTPVQVRSVISPRIPTSDVKIVHAANAVVMPPKSRTARTPFTRYYVAAIILFVSILLMIVHARRL
jgi:hypothetical protein